MKLIYFFVLISLNSIHGLPQVRVRPQSAVLLSSSEVRLICQSDDTPFMSVAYWTHVGQRIELNPSVIEMHGNELRIYQFGDTAYTQPGAYACVVSTRYGLLESEPAMLSLPTLDPFKMTMNEINTLNITEGNIAVIPCELPIGNPRPIPMYTLDNNRIEIDPNSHRHKILPTGNLHISDVRPSDSGKYQCSAKNPLTEQVVNNDQITVLQVLNKPSNPRERRPLFTVYKPPVASRVLVGANFSMECAIAGWPKPTIEWEKYGDVLPEKRHEVSSGTLYLYNIHLDDRGTYICRASNSNSQSDIAYTALLEVLEPPKVTQQPDALIQIKKGESMSIKCGFRGRPEPTISWLYNGEEFTINGSPATDTILPLNQPKEGIYQCIGRNPYGIAQASTALILANKAQSEEPLEVDLPAKKSLIIFAPNNITAYEGETIQLHCLTQPGSTVQWLHNNEIINLNQMRRYEMLPSGGLRIVSAQKSDSGMYECVASKIDFGTNVAKCFVHVQGLGLHLPVSKLEIVNINQLDQTSIRLFWKVNETIENVLSSIQIQYRTISPRTSWRAINDFYNRSVNDALVQHLQQDQTYKFRLIGFDNNGKQLVISAAKRFTFESKKIQPNSPIPQITDAWITNEGQISLRWQLLNNTSSETVDGFVIYYRSVRSKTNFTAITIPNLRFPSIDTYTISAVEPDHEYELRMATYSNRGLSPMSDTIRITVPLLSPEEHHPRANQINAFHNIDEILENMTKNQNPSRMSEQLVTSSLPPSQKRSDMIYLTVGIIAGILLILMIILISMCILRLLQRKKLLAHIKSASSSEYYCDGLHKNLSPDYIQHGVVSVDGKLIPFTYPTNSKSPQIYCHALSQNSITNENSTIRLNANPMSHLDNENLPENFYHTLTPFSPHSPYEECQNLFERPTVPSCPLHHRLANYTSDTLPPKTNQKKNDPAQMNNNAPISHVHYHHGTCQRQHKSKGMLTPLVNKVEQQSRDGFKHTTPPSTGSSHSSSGIGSSMESPYNHWKYLIPLSVATATKDPSTIIEPIPLTSS